VDFYVVAATVLPVLYVAVILQGRTLARAGEPWRFAIAQVLVVITFAGELNALDVALHQHANHREYVGTAIALLMLGLFLVAEPLFEATRPMDESLARHHAPRWLRMSYGVAAGLVFGGGWGIVAILSS
jgi:hypothetical protein